MLPFLRAIATRVEIRAGMAGCGYTEQEQAYGWKLLLEATGYVPNSLPETDDPWRRRDQGTATVTVAATRVAGPDASHGGCLLGIEP